MAQRVVVTLSDDIDGSEAAETIAFGLDGKSYEIDLNEANAKKLRKALAPYVDSRPQAVEVGPDVQADPGRPGPGGRPRLGPGQQAGRPRTRPDPQEGLRGVRRGPVGTLPSAGPQGSSAGFRGGRLGPDLDPGDNRLALPPGGSARVWSTPRGKAERPGSPESRGCSSVVEHPPSRGKAQCAIPVTRSGSLTDHGCGSGKVVLAPIGGSRSEAMRT